MLKQAFRASSHVLYRYIATGALCNALFLYSSISVKLREPNGFLLVDQVLRCKALYRESSSVFANF